MCSICENQVLVLDFSTFITMHQMTHYHGCIPNPLPSQDNRRIANVVLPSALTLHTWYKVIGFISRRTRNDGSVWKYVIKEHANRCIVLLLDPRRRGVSPSEATHSQQRDSQELCQSHHNRGCRPHGTTSRTELRTGELIDMNQRRSRNADIMILIGSTALRKLIPCLFVGMLRLLCGLISPNEKAAIDMNMVSIHTCSSNCTLCPHSMCNLWRLTHLAPTGVLSTISANMGDPLPNSHRGLDRGDHESLEKPSRLLGLHKIGPRPTALTLFPYFD